MSKIVAGRFDATVDADAALDALRREGFRGEEIDSFYVAPPGQHAITPIGGDTHESPGTQRTGAGAIVGAIIVGAIGGAVGWAAAGRYEIVAIIVGILVGAYIGSFIGGMSRSRGGRREEASIEHPVEPQGGRLVAVCVDRSGTEPRAARVLREHGARDLGRAEGKWRNGWKDFDPRAPLGAL